LGGYFKPFAAIFFAAKPSFVSRHQELPAVALLAPTSLRFAGKKRISAAVLAAVAIAAAFSVYLSSDDS